MSTAAIVFAVIILYYLIMAKLHWRWLANQKKKVDPLLLEKYQAGLISEDEVITKSQDPATIMEKLRSVQAGMAADEEEEDV